MSYIVRLGPAYFPNANSNRPIRYGRIYVGDADTDPTVTANQQTVTALLEDGNEVSLSQPILTSAGGVPIYNGRPVSLKVPERYSLSVLNQSGGLEYYVASNFASDDDEVIIVASSLSAEDGSEISVNDDGLDCDFRVESETNSCAFFIRASDSNFGFNNCTLETWNSVYTSLQIGGNASIIANTIASADTQIQILQNAYIDSGGWKHQIEDEATRYYQYLGQHIFNVAVSGIADSAINWVHSLSLKIDEVVFNEGSADIDFRIESDLNAYSFFLQGSSGNIGLDYGTLDSWASGIKALQLRETGSISASDLTMNVSQNAFNSSLGWRYQTANRASLYQQGLGHLFYSATVGTAEALISWISLLSMTDTETVFNDDGADIDFRVESDTLTHAFFIDGATGNVSFGNSTISFGSTYNGFQFAATGSLFGTNPATSSNEIQLTNNGYQNAGWFRIANDEASQYYQANGTHIFRSALSGAGGSAISWIPIFEMDNYSIRLNASNNDIDFIYDSMLGESFRIYADTGETVFNDAGNDCNFRIESDVNSHSFYMDGATGNILFNHSVVETWPSAYTAIQLGANASFMANIAAGADNNLVQIQNAYWTGVDWYYQNTDEASMYFQNAGQHRFYATASGTADTVITWTDLLQLKIGEAVFNEGGADIDFRVESDTKTHALFIDGATGNIGINSAADASYQLSIAGAGLALRIEDTDVVGLYHDFVGSGNSGLTIFTDSGNVASGSSFNINIDNDLKFSVYDTGNLTINASQESWSAAFNAMQFGDNSSFMYDPSGIGFFILANAFYDGAWKYQNDGASAYYAFSGGNHTWQTATTGTAENPITWIQNLIIDTTSTTFNEGGADIDFRVESDTNTHAFFVEGSSGNIGIGVSNPSDFSSYGYNLVVGDGTGNSGLTIFSDDEGYGSIHFGDGTTGNDSYECQIYFKHGAADDFISFAIAAATKLIISNSITHFNSEGADIDFRVESDTVTNAIFMDGATGIVSLPACYSHDMNGETYRDLLINDSGELGYDSSTIRKKTNVVDMEDVSWLYDLRPVNFEYKRRDKIDGKYLNEGTGLKKYGLIAEELEAVNSDFIFYEDGQPEGIHYREFTSVLIKALQDQNNRINYLESKLEEICPTLH